MADTKSQDYAENQFNATFRSAAFSKPTALLYHLLNAAAGATDTVSSLTSGGKMITATGYAPIDLPPDNANYTYTKSTYQGVNAVPVVFSGMTASPQQTASHFAVSRDGGELVHFAALPNAIPIGGAPTTVTIAAGDVKIDMNG